MPQDYAGRVSLSRTFTPDTSRFWMRTWACFIFFSIFAGQLYRNLLGYWGFGIVAFLIFASSAVALLVTRPAINWRRTPKSLLAFLLFATLSIAWSAYPGGSALGVTTQWMSAVVGAALALTLSWQEFVRTFGVALRWLLGLSLLFELWVAVAVGHPLLPNFMDITGPIPKAFYWSRDLLLHGGPIEGLVANRNLLGFAALLALIVFSVQLAAQTVRRSWGITWLVVAAAVMLLTRSSTVIVALVVVVLVALFTLLIRRQPVARRARVYWGGIGVAALIAVGVWLARGPLLALLGKSEDFTGRFDIWATVGHMASERPVAGWGWIGYWQPWVSPFDHLIEIKGVLYLQAHNAWLDVAMQVGTIGLIVFAAWVLSTLARSWFMAVDQPHRGLSPAPYAVTTLLPILLVTALLVQSFAESRLLVEGNFILLVALSFITKRNAWVHEDAE